MGDVKAVVTMSLDGFVAGPNQTLEQPLGAGADDLHAWMFRLSAFREQHGMSGGETNEDTEVLEESIADVGAEIMGRRMFSGGVGPWEDDPNANGWWGDDPPFHVPVFVLTHHAREPLELQGGTTFHFVTDGIESALERARAAAGDRHVSIGGGGETIVQFLNAGLLDELRVSVAPLLLGGGVRLFEGADPRALAQTRVRGGIGVAHLSYDTRR